MTVTLFLSSFGIVYMMQMYLILIVKESAETVNCIQVWVWQKLKYVLLLNGMHREIPIHQKPGQSYKLLIISQCFTEWFWLPFVPDQRFQGQKQMSFKFYLINVPQQHIYHFQRLHVILHSKTTLTRSEGKKRGMLNKYY